jgi:hypothetical protein
MRTKDAKRPEGTETADTWMWEGVGSRYRLKGFSPSVTVVLGWDAPLSTYFVQVWDVPAGASHHEDGKLLLWLGCSLGELRSPADVARAISRYAALPVELSDILYADEVAAMLGLPPCLALKAAEVD